MSVFSAVIATKSPPLSLGRTVTTSASSVRPSRVSQKRPPSGGSLLAVSSSYTWPVSRCRTGTAIDTFGRSSSVTVSVAVAAGSPVDASAVPVTVTAWSPSSTSLCLARIVTVPVAAVSFAANDSVRLAPTNSQRSVSPEVAVTVTSNASLCAGSTAAVIAVCPSPASASPSAIAAGSSVSVTATPSTMVTTPVPLWSSTTLSALSVRSAMFGRGPLSARPP